MRIINQNISEIRGNFDQISLNAYTDVRERRIQEIIAEKSRKIQEAKEASEAALRKAREQPPPPPPPQRPSLQPDYESESEAEGSTSRPGGDAGGRTSTHSGSVEMPPDLSYLLHSMQSLCLAAHRTVAA